MKPQSSNFKAQKNIFLIFCFLILGLSLRSFADYAPGKIIVKFKPGVMKGLGQKIRAQNVPASVKALNTKNQVKQVRQLYQKALENRPDWRHLEDYYVISFPRTRKPQEVAKEYRQNENVQKAVPSQRVYAFTTPNDSLYALQYGLTNIKSPQAWNYTTGSSSVTVAVLDTGIDLDHADLLDRIDLVNGYDFVNNDSDPSDDYGHGTAVSGVIAATTNNNRGVAGVDWNCKILPLKVLDSSGSGDIDDILAGLAYASSLSVEVVNMSLGLYNHSSNKYVEENLGGIKDRCQDAFANGAVLVAAAGNGDVDWNTYPAYYSSVIAVAAVDQSDQRSEWTGTDPQTGRTQKSNYGDWVDVAAPGTSIWTTSYTGGYSGGNNGTSLASPFVAGLAALIKASKPNASPSEVMALIKNNTDDIDNLQETTYQGKLGTGRINANKAVGGLIATIITPEANAYLNGLVEVYGTASGWMFASYEVVATYGTLETQLSASNISVETGLLAGWQTTALNGGYTVKLKLYATNGNTAEASQNVTVDNLSPEAQISQPVNSTTISNAVTIIGTASDESFQSYILEYGKTISPSSYNNITTGYNQVSAGFLGTWETTGLDGLYSLRLRVFDRAGNVKTKKYTLTVQNSLNPTKEVVAQAALPYIYALPNPSTGEVFFNYNLADNFATKIYVFDLNGTLIWQQNYQAGENGAKAGSNNPSWDGQNLFGTAVPNGIYLFRLISNGKSLAKGKLIILRN